MVEVTANNAKIRPVDVPQEEPILVSLERLRRCPKELGDEFWPARKPKKKKVIHKRSKVIRGRMMLGGGDVTPKDYYLTYRLFNYTGY